MSKIFAYPHNPLPWNAEPIDFAKAAGDVPYMGVYAVETTQRYVPGTRHITWDGRVFKYSKAVGTVGGGRLAFFYADVSTYGIAYTTVANSQVVGDTIVSVASQSFAKDILAGGMVLLYGASYTYYQQRGIIGNNYCSSSQVNINLEAPLSVAITTASTGIEVMPNPYLYIYPDTDAYMGASGIPAARAVSGQFFWQQTWGLCNVEPGMTLGGAYDHQLVTGMGAGACYLHTAAYATTEQSQHIGFVVDKGNSPVPFVMLQISI
jgi:hypothetical protein